MSWANIAAFMPEPHILLTVVQPAASGRPAPRAAWRAGAWPSPAGSTQPIRTSSIVALGDARALDRGLDGDRAELGALSEREVALKAAHRRAGGADDDDGIGGVMIGVSSESPEWFGAIGLTLSLQGGRDAAGWVWKAGRCR